MITRELLDLSDLIRTQTLCIHELMEVVKVCKNEDLVFTAFQVMPPSFQGLNNGQEFLIVDIVTGLSEDHLLRKKSN